MHLHDQQRAFTLALKNQLHEPNGFNYTDNFSARERLQVYRGSITMSHVNALKLIYPVSFKLLGEMPFMAYAKEYYWMYPTPEADMNLFGAYWPEYMQHCINEKEALAKYPFLSDLSLLEFYLHQCFYSKDDPLFDFSGFQLLTQTSDDFVFHTGNSLTIMVSQYSVKQIHDMHKQGNAIHKIDEIINSEFLCVFRKEYNPTVEVISESMFHFLKETQSGQTLSQMSQNTNLQLEQNLAIAVSRGWITGFSESDSHKKP